MKIIRKHEYECMQLRTERLRSSLQSLLQSVLSLMNNSKFRYQYNEAGTGDVCYKHGADAIRFNEFPSKFNGFYINNREVSISEVIKLLSQERDTKEWEDEVFIYDDEDGESRSLVIIDKKNNNMFSLEAKNYYGELTEERKKKMKSIGVFSVYD